MGIDLKKEQQIETYLRKHKWFLYAITFITSALLYLGMYYSLQLFKNGHYWSLLLSGLFAHSFFVITMHDGAHKSITQTKLDEIIMTVCSGLIILPFYTELFKKYHLLHHAYTNSEKDPLWTKRKENIFLHNRKLYVFLQCLPFAFNIYILLGSEKEIKKSNTNAYKPKILNMILSVLVALITIIIAKPGFLFVLGTFTVMTALGAIRYWGEHMGVSNDLKKESNTHWFPLGMGIGNHEVHHKHAGFSWLTLTIGLLYRKVDTHPLKSIYGLFFDKRFRHYKKVK